MIINNNNNGLKLDIVVGVQFMVQLKLRARGEIFPNN